MQKKTNNISRLKHMFFLLFFLLLISSSFSFDFEYTLDYKEPITPFTVIPIFFDNVPKDVYAIRTNVYLNCSTNLHNYVEKHSAYYPILTNNDGEYFSLIHFMWMFNENQINALEKMTQAEKNKYLEQLPKQVKIDIDYDKPFTPYYELLKVRYNTTENKREIETKWDLKTEATAKNIPGNKTAIVFLHGLQNSIYDNIRTNLNEKQHEGWHTEELKNYWKYHYQFEDIDYFEYHYDTYFHTSRYYGEKLAFLMEKAGILDQYNEIYLVSYSMGTIVGQYAINTKLSHKEELLGERITNLFLIGGVLEGTYFVNLTDYILEYINKELSLTAINTNFNDGRDTFLYEVLSMLNNYMSLLLDPEKTKYFLDQFVNFYSNNPIISCLLLTSFDDIPITGGQIVPYEGIKSMRYTSSEFLTKLESEFNFGKPTYIINEELNLLNHQHQFKNKIILMTSYASNSEDFLSKTSALIKYINFVPDSGNGVSATKLLDIPFIQYMIQRVLSTIIQSFAEIVSESAHTLNDGFVTQWSQSLTPHQEGVKKENIYIFNDLDHSQIKNSKQVLNIIKQRID